MLASLVMLIPSTAISAEDSEARRYNLSMAGALISNWCVEQWEPAGYISIHACNYQIAHRYNLDVSSVHFDECVILSSGDIVRIADCMLSQFDEWSHQELDVSK